MPKHLAHFADLIERLLAVPGAPPRWDDLDDSTWREIAREIRNAPAAAAAPANAEAAVAERSAIVIGSARRWRQARRSVDEAAAADALQTAVQALEASIEAAAPRDNQAVARESRTNPRTAPAPSVKSLMARGVFKRA